MDILRVTAASTSSQGILQLGHWSLPCALGRAGLTGQKREGDGKTPLGRFPLRLVCYRPDRLPPPRTPLPLQPLLPADGWCDDPLHRDYNQPVRLPHSARCEQLWREDGLYDLFVVIGYNDDPPQPGLGSAIFLHVARPGLAPTEGCVAIPLPDLKQLVSTGPRIIEIRAEIS